MTRTPWPANGPLGEFTPEKSARLEAESQAKAAAAVALYRGDEDADLVTVDEGSDAPMHVVREGVSLEADEAQWRADNAVGLELGRRPLTVDPAAVETQAQFNARQAQGRAERLTRRPVTDPFRRLPVLDESAF